MVQSIGSIWSLMSLTPYGGQSDDEDAPEGWPQAPQSFWYRRHDEFDEPPSSATSGVGGRTPTLTPRAVTIGSFALAASAWSGCSA
jgi:hypothetical protein